MSQISFGVGALIATPPAGSADLTPIQIALLKEVSIDLSMETKELKGDKLFPVDEQISGGKISGKAKTAEIHAALLLAVLGTTATVTDGASQKRISKSTGVIAGATFDTGDSATAVADLGVRDENGDALKKVAAGPIAGQYSYAAGVYTFHTAANGKVYTVAYSKTLTTGKTIVSSNVQVGGSGIRYTMELYNETNGDAFGCKLHRVLIPKLSLGFKSEDYTEQDLDFTASADASGNMITFWTQEQ